MTKVVHLQVEVWIEKLKQQVHSDEYTQPIRCAHALGHRMGGNVRPLHYSMYGPKTIHNRHNTIDCQKPCPPLFYRL